MSTILRLHIVSALRQSDCLAIAREVPPSLVYSYPTVGGLTKCILNLVGNPDIQSTPMKSHPHLIEEMIAKYSRGLDVSPPPPKVPPNTENHYVLLTGSTGNLGAELLAALVVNDSVHRIYALNRPSLKVSILNRHCARFEDKGLDVSLLTSPKLVFLESEACSDNLGLPQETINEVGATFRIPRFSLGLLTVPIDSCAKI